jgi:hypothetical protein
VPDQVRQATDEGRQRGAADRDDEGWRVLLQPSIAFLKAL